MDKSSMRAGSCLITLGALLGGLLGSLWLFSGAFKAEDFAFGIGSIVIGGALVYGGWRLRQRGKQRWGIKELQEMSPSDLPGVDRDKFRAWQNVQSEATAAARNSLPIGLGGTGISFILRVFFGAKLLGDVVFIATFLTWMLYMILRVRPIAKRANELRKEAGIDLNAQ